MKVWKIRHKKSGLFYQPRKGRFSGKITNLGPKGRIYEIKPKIDKVVGVVAVTDRQILKYNIKTDRPIYNRFQAYTSHQDAIKDLEVVEYLLVERRNKWANNATEQ